jgi:hypothetical protein
MFQEEEAAAVVVGMVAPTLGRLTLAAQVAPGGKQVLSSSALGRPLHPPSLLVDLCMLLAAVMEEQVAPARITQPITLAVVAVVAAVAMEPEVAAAAPACMSL